MKLIKETGLKNYSTCGLLTHALFECPGCGEIVEKPKQYWTKVKYCNKCSHKYGAKRGKTKHGECIGGEESSLYHRWHGMKSRTRNENEPSYRNYGERGIKMCKEWDDINVFLKWAKTHGYKKELDIDRIDNNGDYSPDNCRFVTHQVNLLNKRKREDFGIYFDKSRNGYCVWISIDGENTYGCRTKDIEYARKVRDELLSKRTIF